MAKHADKILFLGISAQLGGAERSLYDLVCFSQKSGLDVTVILPEEGPLLTMFQANQIDVKILPLPHLYRKLSRKSPISFAIFSLLGLPSFVIYIKQLYSLIKHDPSARIHSTGIKNHILLMFLSLFSQKYFFIHLRDYLNNFWLRFYFSLFSKKTNIHWMAASHAITKNLKWPISVFYDGLDPHTFFRNRSIYLKDFLNIPSHKKLIAHIAALTPWKGQKLFIEAACEMIKKNPDLSFVIVGSPIYNTQGDENYLSDLKNLVFKKNMETAIFFVPFQKNPSLIYNSVDAIVHCSLAPEPFGRVIVEALFCETPVVAANAGGVSEIFCETNMVRNLHTPGNINSLIESINYTLDNTQDFENLYAHIKTRFDAQTCYSEQVRFFYDNPKNL